MVMNEHPFHPYTLCRVPRIQRMNHLSFLFLADTHLIISSLGNGIHNSVMFFVSILLQ